MASAPCAVIWPRKVGCLCPHAAWVEVAQARSPVVNTLPVVRAQDQWKPTDLAQPAGLATAVSVTNMVRFDASGVMGHPALAVGVGEERTASTARAQILSWLRQVPVVDSLRTLGVPHISVT